MLFFCQLVCLLYWKTYPFFTLVASLDSKNPLFASVSPVLRHIPSIRSIRSMKVTPMRQKANKMKKYSKADQYFVFAIHTLTVCLGVSPFKFNKQTGEISFKWFSCETICSLVRLLVFNAPFSFLPVILMFFFGEGEWEPEERSRFVNVTSQHVSKSTVFMAVVTVEYVSCYSYFILFRAAKKCLFYIKEDKIFTI